ncbi:SecDF P1 head subdomain-containing protein [Nocardioides sp. AE5]|uniref:SecDF P1 head subdomain-containing protein n=1 Tax=Nocardioides sp. AE5 TaxID=2962573 RepID=UPI002882223A|nr:hypothetical protein [Nocardioides sp. AE5]MDT0200897.1 hypothetical protein [Nocardioides sp. AE5]
MRPIATGVAALFLLLPLAGCGDAESSGEQDPDAPGSSETVPASEEPASDWPASNEPTSTSPTAPTVALGIHPVVAAADSVDAEPSEAGNAIVVAADGAVLEIGPAALTEADVLSASAEMPENGVGWVVRIEFTDEGNARFGDLTEAAGCAGTGDPGNRIAIMADGELVSAPAVTIDCGVRLEDGTDIAGNFTEQEATDLAASITGR